jgi:hypothetical protein
MNQEHHNIQQVCTFDADAQDVNISLCLLTADLSFENPIQINILIIAVTSQPDTQLPTHAFCRRCLSPPHRTLVAIGSVAARVSPSTIEFMGNDEHNRLLGCEASYSYM